MSATEFRRMAENGQTPVDSHVQLLRLAYIYSYDPFNEDGVFDDVEKLHKRGWSFGKGDLKLNRTFDVFYLAQMTAAMWRSGNHGKGDFPGQDDFDAFYAQQQDLLTPDIWTRYYSRAFLAQPTSARFYRLPNLQDLPDTTGELGKPRPKGAGHFNKLPRWADTVATTHWRQPTLPLATMTDIALCTLRKTIQNLKNDSSAVSVQPYSETQARFWLKEMHMESPPTPLPEIIWRPHHHFGADVALGMNDIWAWEVHYSPERWVSAAAKSSPLEPDLDGTRKSEVYRCGWPEGFGVVNDAWGSGWDPEVGSEEEIAFMAAVAVKETDGVRCMTRSLDYGMRSHMLYAVLRIAFRADEDADKEVENLRTKILDAGRLEDETAAERWIREGLRVMKSYVQKLHGVWPDSEDDRTQVFRDILEENGQLFGRYKLSPWSKEYGFELGPRRTQ